MIPKYPPHPVTHRQLLFRAAMVLLAAVALMLLQGCGLTPHTPREAIADGYGAITAAAHSAQSLHTDGMLSDRQTEQVRVQLQQAKDALDAAHQALMTQGPDASAVTTGIAQSRAILQAVRQMLLTAQEHQHGS